MVSPTERNAECHIQAQMSMIDAYRKMGDFERDRALLAERFPHWKERGVMYCYDKLGYAAFQSALPEEWFALGIMFVLHEQGKL